MAHDVMSQFYTCLNLPLQGKLSELARIIDQSSPNKDLQTLFPQLINNIFSFNNGWGLKTCTYDDNRHEFELLISFFEPLGPMFRLCYKLLGDPQLKYNLPLNVLPVDLQMILERGRYPQFYADMLTVHPQTLNVVALALNPFDYYMFNFALHLINNVQNKSAWENWNSVYFSLACDYLMHFLPSDPHVPILPHIPNYAGKVPNVAPLQTVNRPLCSPSLLLIPDLSGISNQPSSTQSQSRNEVWRSETVLQVFIDIWTSVEQFNPRNVELYQRSYPIMSSSPERVRLVRVLVKHIHSYSAKHLSDPASRSSALRKYARQIMCTKAYHYIKYLVTTWPLDTSFRLVLELWLSFIQPWRYTGNTISRDKFPTTNNNREEGNLNAFDPSFTQFIAENYPSYTCIFQLMLPRFMRLDLTAYKNAVMLFRLGKVFAQPNLVPVLKDLENAITENNVITYHSPDTSINNSSLESSYYGYYNGANNYNSINKWVAIAKQAISELNLTTNFEYEPIWSEKRKQYNSEFLKKILSAKMVAEKNTEEFSQRLNQQNQGFWATLKNWFMLGNSFEEEQMFEECRKVPTYLNNATHYFSIIFDIQDTFLLPQEPIVEETLEHSSFSNSTNFPFSITNKLRNKPTGLQYMGDPDLSPITSYESTILVRIFYQFALKLNELYSEEFVSLWNRSDLLGYVAREILQKPCTIHSYVKDSTNHQKLVSEELPARLSLRRLGSHSFVIWFVLGYVLFRLFSYSGFFYLFSVLLLWSIFVLSKASLKYLKIMKS